MAINSSTWYKKPGFQQDDNHGEVFNDEGNKASGAYSHAEGCRTLFPMGDEAYGAEGDYSHTEGLNSTSTGKASHAEGNGTKASGDYSHAEGHLSETSGEASHAEGYNTNANSNFSHAEGSATTAQGICSHAEGGSTFATGDYSHAEGRNSTMTSAGASGDYSHTEGLNTKANGSASHAEGNSTEATGYYSHAEGSSTEAIGNSSHAEGTSTVASGSATHAEGYYTIAKNSYEHAGGFYNLSHSGSSTSAQTIHSIGVGTSATRKNAFEVMKNGDVYCNGIGGYSGTSLNNTSPLKLLVEPIPMQATSTTTYLDSADSHFIWINGTSNKTIYLPSSPYNGMQFKILKNNGANLVLQGNGHQITRPGLLTASSHTFSSTAYGLCNLWYISSLSQWILLTDNM